MRPTGLRRCHLDVVKTATLPAVRVSFETRALIESVLKDGESLSAFIEENAKRQATWRRAI